jgi:hypothetical protein
MSELGPRARTSLPAVGLLTLGAGVAMLLATAAGFAPFPPLFQVALTLLAAALLGLAVTGQVRAARDAWRATTTAASGIHRRGRRAAEPDDATPRARPATVAEPSPGQARPAWTRIAIVAAAVAVLALVLWVRPKPIGSALFSPPQFLFGYFAAALPLLPLLLLAPTPREPRDPYPWRVPVTPLVDRRLLTREDLALLLHATLLWLRERLFTRATGVVVATLGLLHLVRGAPHVGDGGTRRAAGLFGFAIAEPLRLAFASGGAIALLVAVLACAGLVITAHVGQYRGITAGYVALAVALVLPLLGTSAAHWFGFDYYLTTQGSRVVVVAGLSPTHRQAVYDAGLGTGGLTRSLRTLFAAGLPVADRDDGSRIAKALAKPNTSSADKFVGDEYELKIGNCFDWIGGSSQLRYVAPCNGSHVGEVYFVGHLPFTVNPGKKAVDASARAMCEQSYGDYLGVPFGQSFLPMETPLVPAALAGDGWVKRPVIACWLGSVGPWALKGSKTVAALQQNVPWDAANGCKIEVPDTLKVTAGAPGTRCVAPGPNQRLSVDNGGFTIDLEFAAIGKAAGAARIGAACLDGTNLGNGYTFEVTADGTIEVWKYAGDQHTKLGASAKPKGIGGPGTASTAMQVSCHVNAAHGVDLVANSTGGRKVSTVDANAPITHLSPRLLFVNADVAPSVMSVVIFNATRS